MRQIGFLLPTRDGKFITLAGGKRESAWLRFIQWIERLAIRHTGKALFGFVVASSLIATMLEGL